MGVGFVAQAQVGGRKTEVCDVAGENNTSTRRSRGWFVSLSPLSLSQSPRRPQELAFTCETQCTEQIKVTKAESREIRRYFIATQAMQVRRCNWWLCAAWLGRGYWGRARGYWE